MEARANKKKETELAKREYIEGYVDPDSGMRIWPSIREVAKRHGISYENLGRKSKKEQWTVERDQFRQEVEQERKERVMDQIAGVGADLDLAAVEIATTGLQRLNKFMKQADSSEVYTIAMAAKTLHQMGRLACGESTDKNVIDVGEIKDVKQRLLSKVNSFAQRKQETGAN
ncbi:MAG: hypothetical protein EF811_02950 [Methanonatronarchaeia archaeon]|nr:MAG: hypothetical protein EF811_02950 [Methanonatronarchaeia archaeon]